MKLPMKLKRITVWLALALAALGAGVSMFSQGGATKPTPMSGAAAFRILFGVGDTEPTAWDGSAAAAVGAIESIQIWRPHAGDSTDSKSTWTVSSGSSFVAGGRPGAGQAAPILENGVIIAATLPDDGARIEIKTKQGNFSFQARDVPFGVKRNFINGRVAVDRVPDTVKLTASIEDQDYPAIAQSGDEVYATYVEFVRGDRSVSRWSNMGGPKPASLDFVARPAGGDQVFLVVYSKSKKTWGAPLAVTSSKQDIMRASVAVDGQKRVWVVYSANRNGNFDIYAKARSGARFGDEVRITSSDGVDLNPVATADSSGRLWVAWQGYRNGSLEVLAAAWNGKGFTKATVVSSSRASDWDPSIAAASNGEVAIAWDTYDKGDYDVYFRRVRFDSAVKMDDPVPVAASTRFESRASIAYDSQNRLWVAYETSGAKWGKDTGPYDNSGIPLYRDHSVQVKCFEGSKVYRAAGDNLAGVLPRAVLEPFPGGKKGGQQQKKKSLPADEHDTAGTRPGAMAFNSFPRLAADPSGMLYLAYRTRTGVGRSSLGTVWQEQVVYFDGAKWNGPVTVPNGDYWIDSRPAMAPLGPGHLMMLVSTDHRQSQTMRMPGQRGGPQLGAQPDAINADVYAAEMILPPGSAASLEAVAAEKVAAPDELVAGERKQVEDMRRYQATVGGQALSVLRGEFHRHTDVSVDGQGDGPLIDAYRYMIDAAAMDWGGCCDHDNGTNEFAWWTQQKLTDAYKLGDRYLAMFSYERSVQYPEGHRNVVMPRRGIRPLPRLAKTEADAPGHAPDTQMLYEYLHKYDGIVASHTSGTDMGTDWRDNDPKVEPVVEIYQGCRQNYEMPGAPRCNTADYSIGGWRPLGFVSLALKKGYRLAFQASSDHGSTHISYCNLWVTKRTREGVMEAFKKRRVYGATDNILAEVRSGPHFMGEEFSTSEPPSISVKLAGTAEFSKVHIIRDGEYVYSTEPKTRSVDFTWKDATPLKGKTSYYYVRGEQADGELVWASPMWITYQ
jgi:hypothetical protein